MTEPYQPDIMIYHANCADGFGAAWAAWMRWGDAVQYVPCAYGEAPPEVLGKHVLIGDFSFKRDVIERIANGAASITILDHHETAEEDLLQWRRFMDKPERFTMPVIASMIADLQRNLYLPVNALFDKARSGAVMTWEFCHPGEPVPLLLQLIQDRDLWRFTMQETKPFNVWLRCEPFDFERWTLIAQQLNDGRDAATIFAEAAAMQRFFDQKVAEMAARTRYVRIGGHVVPGCNCTPEFSSEVAHAILRKHSEARFAACYWDTSKGRSWSLRSDHDGDYRLDVSEIAKAYGGGGHRNAAGFTVPLP